MVFLKERLVRYIELKDRAEHEIDVAKEAQATGILKEWIKEIAIARDVLADLEKKYHRLLEMDIDDANELRR